MDCINPKKGSWTAPSVKPFVIFFFFVFLSFLLVISQSTAREISPQRECSICHIGWLETLRQTEVTPLITIPAGPATIEGRQDVVSTERMCFSCHDGYVNESRFAFDIEKHRHPVYVKPSEKVTVPVRKDGSIIFPLNANGEIYCGTCHSAHGRSWDELEDKSKVIFLRETTENSVICVACHLNKSTGPEEGNHPVFMEPRSVKIPAERIKELGGRLGAEKGQVICQTCHRVKGAPEKKLLIASNANSEICINCHSDKAGIRGTKHDIPFMAKEHKNFRGEPLSGSGVCGSCHIPHNGRGPRMWARELKDSGGDPLEKLCFSCHSENALAQKKTIGANSHPVGIDIEKLGVETELPLYTEAGGRSDFNGKGKVSCGTCHDPHRWSPMDPERKGGQGIEGTGEDSFLRVAASGESPLCVKCHSDKTTVRNTKHDLRFTAKGSKNILGEVPRLSGVCGGCHAPHNGNSIRMWARKERGKDKDHVSNLCLSCHSGGGLAEKKKVGDISHPVDVSIKKVDILPVDEGWLSKFMQALKGGPLAEPCVVVLPLYNGGGKKDKEGNLTCATCHDPHRWSPDAVPDVSYVDSKGNAATDFLRISNKDSALCRNCHVDKRPVTLSKHNLGISAPDEKNYAGAVTAESGVCSACHVPHNAAGPKLWAKNLSGSGHTSIKMCRSCHSENGPAKNKIVGKNSHPLDVKIKEVMKDTVLPLYSMDGTRDEAGNGKVVCVTCHDPHQWDPGDVNSLSGAEKNTEGDGRNSFLRLPAAIEPKLCVNCHLDKKWIIWTEHDLRVTVPNASNIKGQSMEQSGVCGQCHLLHNSPHNLVLWAREPGPGRDEMEKMCRSCHSDRREAAKKQPLRFNHPEDVLVVSTDSVKLTEGKSEVNFPLYSHEGERKQAGFITCPTCHNPHQWDARKQSYGPGKNTEGNATNSFLRNRSEFSLCTDCHGMDGLFRYKYFHGETAHKKRSTIWMK